MAHNPVNHPAQPIYRAIGGLIGLYLVIFGILGVIETSGGDFFAQTDTLVLGQGTNLGHSLSSAGLGAVILIATGVGRNLDAVVNRWLAYVFMVIGLGCLALLRTDANVFSFTMATCIVTMLIGLVLLTAGMYGKVGTDEENRAWQEARLVL
jgi:hypothetical protein